MIIADSTPNLKWYVLYTYPQYEKKVYNDLLRENFNSFLPVKTVVKQWSDRKKKMEIPLFPNYVFVQTQIKERFKVLNLNGVKRFITFDGSPVTICDREIQAIKRMMSTSNLCVEDNFISGDKVLIQEGVFYGLEGIICKRNGKTRFCVLISGINQVISIDVSGTALVKLNLYN